MAEEPLDLELRMEATDLYQEEMFTDRRAGTLQRLTPVDKTGRPDATRPVLYVGQTQLMSRMGALPLSFEIPADSLEQAVQGFAAAANGALQETLQKLEDMRREQASSLIVPGSDFGGGGMGGGMSGGGGGRIRMP